MLRRRVVGAVLLLVLVCLSSRAAEVDMLMGNPSKATTDKTKKNNYLMVKEHFALSYSNSKGTPNWVSWHLAQKYLGGAPRKSLCKRPVSSCFPSKKAAVFSLVTSSAVKCSRACFRKTGSA